MHPKYPDDHRGDPNHFVNNEENKLTMTRFMAKAASAQTPDAPRPVERCQAAHSAPSGAARVPDARNGVRVPLRCSGGNAVEAALCEAGELGSGRRPLVRFRDRGTRQESQGGEPAHPSLEPKELRRREEENPALRILRAGFSQRQ